MNQLHTAALARHVHGPSERREANVVGDDCPARTDGRPGDSNCGNRGGTGFLVGSDAHVHPEEQDHAKQEEKLNPNEPAQPATDAGTEDAGVRPVLLLDTDSAAWYRKLGPLPWMALQHLALHAHRTDEGWAAPLGVRGLAAGIGVTKDTAARAITTLTAADLVSRQQVDTPPGRRRSGYLIHLPRSLRLIERPQEPDRHPRPATACPDGEDRQTVPEGRRCIPHPEIRPDRLLVRSAPTAAGPDTPAAWDQPVLFDTPRTASAGTPARRPGR